VRRQPVDIATSKRPEIAAAEEGHQLVAIVVAVQRIMQPETGGTRKGQIAEGGRVERIAVLEIIGGEAHRTGLSVDDLEELDGMGEDPAGVEGLELEVPVISLPAGMVGTESDRAMAIVVEGGDRFGKLGLVNLVRLSGLRLHP
jgi:hypothetical protein